MDPNKPHQRHSDGSSQSRQGKQRTSGERSQARRSSPQPQLPPLILPTHLHSAIDANHQDSSLNNLPDEAAFSTQPQSSTRQRVDLSSPHRSQSSPILDNFDDMSQDGNDHGYAGSSPQQLESSWTPSNQYHELGSPYSSQSRGSYSSQMSQHPRSSPNLPSIRDISQRPNRGHGFDHGYTSMSSPYSQPYTSSSGSNNVQDSSQYSAGRHAFYDPNQRYSQTYPPTNRPYHFQQTDFSRHSQSPYGPYRMNPSYPNMPSGGFDYSSQLENNQSTAYVVAGDCGDNRSRRRRGNLPKPVTDVLRNWFQDHIDHPYPSEEDKQFFMQRTGLTINQVGNWFINARRRHWPEGRRRARDRGTLIMVSDREH